MEGIESFHAYLKSFQYQAGVLAEVAVSLSKTFQAEANRLTREDGAQCLKAIQAVVAEEMEEARRLESDASYGYTKAILPFSLAGLAAKIIVTATTENQRAGTS